MALADAVAGGLRPIQEITWTRADGVPENLAGATLAGYLHDKRTGQVRLIEGDLTITDGPAGVFTWEYDEADVVEGRYLVQFVASFGFDPTPAKTFLEEWRVRPSLALPEEA